MKYLNWDSKKNDQLKRERKISFEEIALIINSGDILDVLVKPGYPNQSMYILNIEDYAVVVPFVESESEIFLKTIFPSRKYTKLYKLGDQNESIHKKKLQTFG